MDTGNIKRIKLASVNQINCIRAVKELILVCDFYSNIQIINWKEAKLLKKIQGSIRSIFTVDFSNQFIFFGGYREIIVYNSKREEFVNPSLLRSKLKGGILSSLKILFKNGFPVIVSSSDGQQIINRINLQFHKGKSKEI